MENASKALLIAGAILLVIAIIAIGMVILGQGQDVVNKTGGQINTMAINAHNSQFGDLRNGMTIKGSELKRIATAVKSNNSQNSGSKVCNVAYSGIELTAIDISKDYTIVSIAYNDSGAITTITSGELGATASGSASI